jgi:DHA1 family multidrug resistance protein-like MFS transporter
LFVENETSATTSTVATQQPKIFHGWLTVAKNRHAVVVSFIQATQYYVYGAVEFFLVGYLTDIVQTDALTIGIIMGSQIVALIITRPIFGRVSDRIGRQTPIILGSISSIIFVAAFPFFTQTSVLLLLSVGYGIGFATVISSTAPLISELVPRELVGTLMGFLGTTMDVGQTLGPIISGFVLALTVRYSALFFKLGLLLILSVLVFVFLIKRTPETGET